MDDTLPRSHLIQQLEALERQVVSLRAQVIPEPPAPVREAFGALGVEIDSSVYALRTSEIQRIIPLVSWQPLPESPDWLLGVFRYRGRTLMLIDLYRRLRGEPAPLSVSMVIVVTKPPRAVGLVATGVTTLLRVAPEQVSPPPTDVSYAPFVIGSIATKAGEIMPLLSIPHLRHELVVGADAEPEASLTSAACHE